ncbi:MAG: OadG family protein [Eubacteriales bacterium]|nr:OadG family protein [Eubacteriales bacterium]
MEMFMEAVQNTLVGMGTVFVVLIFISLIISLFQYIPKIEAALKGGNKKASPVAAPQVETVAAPVEEEEEELVGDDALVAVITAALMAYQGGTSTSKDQLIVRSIKRAKRTGRR